MLTVFNYFTAWLPPMMYVPVLALFTIVVGIAIVKLVSAVLSIISSILGFIPFW